VTNRPTCLLVVDDDLSNLESLEKIFVREGMRVVTATNGKAALEAIRRERVDVVLSDLMMPGMSGIDLVRALEAMSAEVEVVMMTAHGTIETAVDAMRAGAYDFVEKPLRRMSIVKTVQKAAEHRHLLAENRTLKQELTALKTRSIVGTSSALRRALDVAAQAAPSSANVLVLGESGTGKELLARQIHEKSGRTGPFIAVNLAALPETIVESELFGHERGAFTGAHAKRDGRIAQAANGTLFLDEIGELAQAVQVKLLRVLQEGEFEPLGGKTQRADFRLVAATNRDLRAAVRSGDFREDLYYRLNVIAITSPPLRERREDVPLLVEHFLDVYGRKNGRSGMTFDTAAMDKLIAYDWPGNVRELENVIERAVVLAREATLGVADLPDSVGSAERSDDVLQFRVGTPIAEIEQRMIHATLRRTHGDKQLAAQLLGLSIRTVYRRLDERRDEDGTEPERG